MDKRKQCTFVCSERTLFVVGWETRLQVERELGSRKGDGKERERRGAKEQPAWSDQ